MYPAREPGSVGLCTIVVLKPGHLRWFRVQLVKALGFEAPCQCRGDSELKKPQSLRSLLGCSTGDVLKTCPCILWCLYVPDLDPSMNTQTTLWLPTYHMPLATAAAHHGRPSPQERSKPRKLKIEDDLVKCYSSRFIGIAVTSMLLRTRIRWNKRLLGPQSFIDAPPMSLITAKCKNPLTPQL